MPCSSLTPLYLLDIFEQLSSGPRQFGGFVLVGRDSRDSAQNQDNKA
jgi:hypothetical protein